MLEGWDWGIAVDTHAQAPADLVAPALQRRIGARRWRVAARSLMVLEGAVETPSSV